MRILISTLLALSLSVFMFGQDKGKAKKGGPPTNLKMLDPNSDFRATMQVWAKSLGVECDHCHTPGQMADDGKMPKVTARMMLAMVREINGKFPDGKEHVTCFTCHRGSTMPATAP
jgi:hypothetical protein